MYFILIILGAATFVGYRYGIEWGIAAVVVWGIVYAADIAKEQKS